ncbi:MAG TPA: polyphosphate kinase 2 family protein [Thermoanaerobaculia bacterium]
MSELEKYRVAPDSPVKLKDFDPDDTSLIGDKEAAKEASAKLQERLAALQEVLFAEHRKRVLILLQGMDTSGKDGAIRHVMGGFNPQGTRIESFKAPTEPELERDFLWRVHMKVPANGEIVVFNRSHYEDVLVVRVHDLVPSSVWKPRYQQINDFERMLVESGTLVIKLFLHISKSEQKKRLQARVDDPTKRWKFQHSDLEARKLWSDYQKAYEAVLQKTSTQSAPWWVVPANAKWYRNYLVASIVEQELAKLQMSYPEPDLSGVAID